jgi:hypothetical protein
VNSSIKITLIFNALIFLGTLALAAEPCSLLLSTSHEEAQKVIDTFNARLAIADLDMRYRLRNEPDAMPDLGGKGLTPQEWLENVRTEKDTMFTKAFAYIDSVELGEPSQENPKKSLKDDVITDNALKLQLQLGESDRSNKKEAAVHSSGEVRRLKGPYMLSMYRTAYYLAGYLHSLGNTVISVNKIHDQFTNGKKDLYVQPGLLIIPSQIAHPLEYAEKGGILYYYHPFKAANDAYYDKDSNIVYLGSDATIQRLGAPKQVGSQ